MKRTLTRLTRLFPFLHWFRGYSTDFFRNDLVSGVTVALVLVPQSMAYAQLAGLPAYFGLYAAFLPPMVAALFGSSRQLATGPVAIVSLMTATALEPLATAGSTEYIAYAILLALLVGIFQFLLGLFRLGLVVNFLAHPVVNGFTNAAAIIIASSQLSKIFGVTVDKAEHQYELVYGVIVAAFRDTHWPTLALAIVAFTIMILLRRINRRIPNVLVAVVVTTAVSYFIEFDRNTTVDISRIDSEKVRTGIQEFNKFFGDLETVSKKRIALREQYIESEKNLGAMATASIDLRHELQLTGVSVENLKDSVQEYRAMLRNIELRVAGESRAQMRFYGNDEITEGVEVSGNKWHINVANKPLDAENLKLTGGGSVVGNIPRGLPAMIFPEFRVTTALSLFPIAVIISLLGFMEAISIAKAMAAKTGQQLDPNQELIGQGLSNMVGSIGQSYAVSGSFSRSAVNLQAGAVTGLSNVFSSIVVIIVLLFLTPLLYHLPQSVLAAIIMMAVVGLINFKSFVHIWRAQKYDGVISIITFILTLAFAPHLDRGIVIGVILSLIFYLLRNMRPSIAMLSLHPDGTYRNRARFGLDQCRHIAVVRYAGSLFFANVNYLEEQVMDTVRSMTHLKHVLIVGNGINELDASGEEILSTLVTRIHERGLGFSMSGINDHVLDTMRNTGLLAKIGEENIYRNATRAIENIWESAHEHGTEIDCPLLTVPARKFAVAPSFQKSDAIKPRMKDDGKAKGQ